MTLKEKILVHQKDYNHKIVSVKDVADLLDCSESYVNEILNYEKRLQKYNREVKMIDVNINFSMFKNATPEEQENNLKILALYTQKDNKIVMSRELEVRDIV